MTGNWTFGSQRAKYDERREFALYRIDEEDFGRWHVTFQGEKTQVNKIPKDQPIPCPSFVLDGVQQQALIDELWKQGLRPNSRRYEEEIKLQARHISFLETILEKLTGGKIRLPLESGD